MRSLDGNITNASDGTIDIDTNTLFNGNAKTLLNQGTLDLATTKTLTFPSGAASTFTNGAGGSVVATGTGQLFLDDGNTLNQGAGTTSGSVPVVLENSALNYTGTGASSIVVHGTTNTLIGRHRMPAQDLIVQGVDVGAGNIPAKITASASMTNDGDIILTQLGSFPNPSSTFAISSGTLTNTGLVRSEVGGAASATRPRRQHHERIRRHDRYRGQYISQRNDPQQQRNLRRRPAQSRLPRPATLGRWREQRPSRPKQTCPPAEP